MAKGNLNAPVVNGRECGSCTLCCSLLAIDEINKPKGEHCPNCDLGTGCRIYQKRPQECHDFYCGFLTQETLAEYWYPAISRIVVTFNSSWNRLSAYVDPDWSDAWRGEPYYSDLKQWAASLQPTRGQVVVKIGDRAIVILPDQDVDLGIMADDDLIVTVEVETPSGLKLNALKMKLDDPRVTDLVDSMSQPGEENSMRKDPSNIS